MSTSGNSRQLNPDSRLYPTKKGFSPFRFHTGKYPEENGADFFKGMNCRNAKLEFKYWTGNDRTSQSPKEKTMSPNEGIFPLILARSVGMNGIFMRRFWWKTIAVLYGFLQPRQARQRQYKVVSQLHPRSFQTNENHVPERSAAPLTPQSAAGDRTFPAAVSARGESEKFAETC